MADVDYYELLGVAPDATSSEIKSAYRTRVRSAHPDAGGTADTFQVLTEAYETLADPAMRAAYDRVRAGEDRTRQRRERRSRTAPRPAGTRSRPLGDDPGYVPATPVVDVDSLDWWHLAGTLSRVHYEHPGSPGHAPALGAAGGAVLAPLPLLLPVASSVWAFTVWALLLLAATTAGVLLVRRHLESLRAVRTFRAEFGDRTVFGAPGTEPDEVAERLTAHLCERYLTRLPGVRLFHGVSLPGSVYADVDHAVLCGRRLVLVESKRWLPGHYTTDADGRLCRNGRIFRGGGTRLAESIDAFRELLPEVEIRGALVLYPSRSGEITTDPHTRMSDGTVVLTPERFVRRIGDRLAADPVTVDRHVLRTVLDRVVGESAPAGA
ncbi:J domain-containing protein [Saccharomonospora halophila]|uniref:J domain-containing protein n=1 Tax=Saccharomonospora halophila TaxID=129922 RepID=UPI00037D73A0|nr:DnaJ domain-containing protein [Saccharomonospora halophila]